MKDAKSILCEYKWKVIDEIGLFFERRINITEVQDNVKSLFADLEVELKDNAENTNYAPSQYKNGSDPVESKTAKTTSVDYAVSPADSQIQNEINKDWEQSNNE